MAERRSVGCVASVAGIRLTMEGLDSPCNNIDHNSISCLNTCHELERSTTCIPTLTKNVTASAIITIRRFSQNAIVLRHIITLEQMLLLVRVESSISVRHLPTLHRDY